MRMHAPHRGGSSSKTAITLANPLSCIKYAVYAYLPPTSAHFNAPMVVTGVGSSQCRDSAAFFVSIQSPKVSPYASVVSPLPLLILLVLLSLAAADTGSPGY